MKQINLFALILLLCFSTSCARVIRQGEVGVKRKLGKLKPDYLPSGFYILNPFFTRILKVPVRTINIHIGLESLPSKEGLNIDAEMSILFHIQPEYAVKVVQTIGLKHGENIITNVLRSCASDVTSNFYAKDMHTSQREAIEKEISERMVKLLGDRGFVVEAILIKSIRMPTRLSQAIEQKLQAEQEAQQMEFVILKEKKEAERKRIEAEGIRDSQKIISEGLSEFILRYKSIEAFRELSKSSNSKTIITDGKSPIMLKE